MNNKVIRIVNNQEISETDILKIVKLKNQHWSYGIYSQLKWINENLMSKDEHLLLEKEKNNEEAQLLAYVTLSNIECIIDGDLYDMIGVGNVCVDINYKGRGLGSEIMKLTSEYIKKNSKYGMLLCKEELVSFYEKNGWVELLARNSILCGKPYERKIMVLPGLSKKKVELVTIGRNF